MITLENAIYSFVGAFAFLALSAAIIILIRAVVDWFIRSGENPSLTHLRIRSNPGGGNVITSEGRYEPSPGASISLWPIQPIEVFAEGQRSDSSLCALNLYLGGASVLIYDQNAASLERLGHALVRLAEEQRQREAKADLEPLQEK